MDRPLMINSPCDIPVRRDSPSTKIAEAQRRVFVAHTISIVNQNGCLHYHGICVSLCSGYRFARTEPATTKHERYYPIIYWMFISWDRKTRMLICITIEACVTTTFSSSLESIGLWHLLRNFGNGILPVAFFSMKHIILPDRPSCRSKPILI